MIIAKSTKGILSRSIFWLILLLAATILLLISLVQNTLHRNVDSLKIMKAVVSTTSFQLLPSEVVLESNWSTANPIRNTHWLLLANAYLKRNQPANAGEALIKSGVLDKLDTHPKVQLQRLPQARLEEIAWSLVTFLEGNLDRFTVQEISRLLPIILAISRDPSTLSKGYELGAIAAAQSQSYRSAFELIRMSLDVQSPSRLDDKRLQSFYAYGAEIAKENNCLFTPADEIASLVVIYTYSGNPIVQECIHELTQSALAELPEFTRPFIQLRIALNQIAQGKRDDAKRTLLIAEEMGLSESWRLALFEPTKLESLINHLTPTFILDDTLYAGYEFDPIQVALGIPLDIILYRRSSETDDGSSLHWHRTINLAPNPGFEYGDGSLDCSNESCFVAGFESDMYQAEGVPLSPATHRIAEVFRPFLPGGDAQISTRALGLGQKNREMSGAISSSLISFPRQIADDERFLYAAWMRAEEGNGFVGNEWQTNRDRIHQYLIADAKSPDWEYISGVMEPTPETTATKFWLINFDALGTIWFDNIVFVKLPN